MLEHSGPHVRQGSHRCRDGKKGRLRSHVTQEHSTAFNACMRATVVRDTNRIAIVMEVIGRGAHLFNSAWIGVWVLVWLTACGHPQKDGIRGKQREHSDAAVGSECERLACKSPAHCEVGDAGAMCLCSQGYEYDEQGGCKDIDECATASEPLCGAHALCENGMGTYSCVCEDGYVGDGMVCELPPDCEAAGILCHPDATCTNSGDMLACACNEGFSGDGMVCEDVDECAAGKNCGDNAMCQNTRGSFECICDALSEPSADGTCIPGCEAAEADSQRCDSGGFGLCSFDPQGTASCSQCDSSHVGDGKSCQADAECAALGCGDNTVCAGSAGSRSCSCANGYEGDPLAGCTDINECKTGAATCDDAVSECVNAPGGYVCGCLPGFERNKNGVCKNVDECDLGIATCDPNATCKDKTPGYTCTCNDGYEGDGQSCSDIDECATGTHDCFTDETCKNDAGGFQCACPKNYVGDGKSAACYCDLSGFWAMRQDVSMTITERSLANTIFIQESTTLATVWELHKYDYDGSTIKVDKKGCGADTGPQVYSPVYEEAYSSTVPNAFFDQLDLLRAPDVTLPASKALPGKQYSGPVEAAVLGIQLDDPINSPWPETRYDVPDYAWIDSDGDGVPGISMWPESTLSMPTQVKNVDTFSYLPVDFESGTTIVSRRAGCASLASRVVIKLNTTIDRCDRLVGDVENLATEVRVFACTQLGSADWDTLEVKCDKTSWQKARKCTETQIDFLDTQDQTQITTATFEMVKLAPLTDTSMDCQSVRDALPAISRN